MDRRALAASAIGVVVVASVGGFVAGSRITSPAEVASRTAPPVASLILVPVENRLLSTDVVTRGTGKFGSPEKLSVGTSALKPSHGIVAEIPLVGTELAEGAVAVSGSGRPLYVLVGDQPMSRDLGPGLSGDDVKQLEVAVTRLGFDIGTADGVYDEQTEAGIRAWYAASGYSAFEATFDQLATVRTREAELAVASVDQLNANDTISLADAAVAAANAASVAATNRAGLTARAVDRVRAENAATSALAATELAARQATLDALRAGTAVRRGTPGEIAVAEADLATSRANETAAKTAGARAVAEAQSVFDQAPVRLNSATVAAAAANTAAAADVAARQALLNVLVADSGSTPEQIGVGQADLNSARAAAENIRVAGVQAVSEAQAALNTADSALKAARTQASTADAAAAADVASKQAILNNLLSPIPATATEIATAERELAIATTNVEVVRLGGQRNEQDAVAAASEAAADVSVKSAQAGAAAKTLANARQVSQAKASVADRAAQEADLARRKAGVQVPADEVVFVATGPVRVSEVLVGTGDQVVGGLMKVTNALVHVDGGLAVADANLVQVGMTVQIEEPDLGIATTGTVESVAPSPGTNGVDGFHIYFQVGVENPPPNLVGASVRLTIPVDSSAGTVLAVPVSALTLAPDGSSRVQRNRDGTTDFVKVKPGLSADGFVEVTVTEGTLKIGDMVVIGAAGVTTATDNATSDTVTTDPASPNSASPNSASPNSASTKTLAPSANSIATAIGASGG